MNSVEDGLSSSVLPWILWSGLYLSLSSHELFRGRSLLLSIPPWLHELSKGRFLLPLFVTGFLEGGLNVSLPGPKLFKGESLCVSVPPQAFLFPSSHNTFQRTNLLEDGLTSSLSHRELYWGQSLCPTDRTWTFYGIFTFPFDHKSSGDRSPSGK